MEGQVNPPVVTAPKRKPSAKKPQEKAAAQKGASGADGTGGVPPNNTRVLRVVDANAAGASTSSTPSSDAEAKRSPAPPAKEKNKASRPVVAAAADGGSTDKENSDVVPRANEGEATTARRANQPKARGAAAATPASTRTAPTEPGGPAPSRIQKTEVVKPKQDAVPARKNKVTTASQAPKMERRDDGDAGSETEKTVVADAESNHDGGQDRHMDKLKPADTQDDLLGLPLPRNDSPNPSPIPAAKPTASEKSKSAGEESGKFPGWDDYPPLSVYENDRESRARGRNYYRAYGVRFAPFNIPWRRRLQTLAVVTHSLSIASTVSFFFFLCAIPLTWPLLVPYLLYMLLSDAATDGRLRFRSERFRRLPLWGFFADYFPARLHKTHDLPPTRKYIFGYHPHGIISHGAFSAFATEALGFSQKFPGIQNSLLTLDSNFRIPLYREYVLSLGIMSVSKQSITNILSRGGRNGEGMGRAVTIVVGGARESLEAQPGTLHLVLAERKGFIKVAVRTGADLVPVLAFGENDLYDQVSPETHPWLRRAQMYALRTLKFTLPFLHGRGIFNYDVGLMPYRRPLNIVVGRPIKVTQARSEADVDMAEVDRLHREYVAELEKMWERYKGGFAADRKEEMLIMK
ncbi:diacylglycerol acyltransferase-domain-containing protein [Schizothecium vesticola]|uniref:diacylglycerol O-acyltransferase n=1 Tax=Schizothecium vesticola TaxID=314040 RepID=A0AA40F5M4_9PEZI|nr:diacylglycerol acyltransferase-domain-containing protein [Schizothecium vesticola]